MKCVEKQWMTILNITQMFNKNLNKVMQRHFSRSKFCEKFSDAFYLQWEHNLDSIRNREWSCKRKGKRRKSTVVQREKQEAKMRSIWKNRIYQKE